MTRAHRRTTGTALVLVGLVVLILVASNSTVPGRSGGAGSDATTPSSANVGPTPASNTPASVATFVVSGTVWGTPGDGQATPLAGVTVSAYNRSLCAAVASPTSCGVPVATATSESDGAYSVALPNGSYFLASDRGALAGRSYGGSVVSEVVAGSGHSGADLTGWPFVPYGNATVVLPGFNCLSSYLWQVPGSKSGSSEQCQNPLLSWTQDGFFYVNDAEHLVFYSAVNGSVQDFGPWVPLYTNFANYVMVQNEEFLTQDSAYVYGWGTLAPGNHTLVFEAVNVSTKQHFEHSFTGITTWNVTVNGQLEMTGFDGNDSIVTLIGSKGQIVDYDLWNGTQWSGPTLPYFEANNVYWVPYLNGYIDLQANGSAAHRIGEWQLTGPSGTLLATYSSVFTATGIVNGVNGWAYNVTSHVLSFSVEDAHFTQDAFSVDPETGVLQNEVSSRAYVAAADSVGGGAGAFVQESDQSRGSLVSDGDVFQANAMGFANDSWIQNPATFEYESTNVSPLTHFWDAGAMSTGTSWDADSMFYNTSYLYSEASIDCSAGEKTQLPGLCTIQGKSGAPPGTIYWYWELGSPEFPFAASNPVAQPDPPLATPSTVANVNATAVQLTWYASTLEPQPILNWTLEWGSGSTPRHDVSLWGQNRSFTLSGLTAGANLSWCVEAWNLHWHGPCEMQSEVIGASPLPSPSALAVVSSGPTWTVVNWTNPPAPFSGDLVYLAPAVGGSCTAFSVASAPESGPATAFNFTGLDPATQYCAEVSVYNATGVSPPSLPFSFVTLTGFAVPPTAPVVEDVTTSSALLTWQQAAFPDGLPDNDTVLAGTDCANWTIRASTGGRAISHDLTGLAPATTYCVAVAAWFGTGAGIASLVGPTATFTTLAFPVAPTALVFRDVTDQSARVTWTQGSFPGAVVGNNTVLVGSTCGLWTTNESTHGPVTSELLTGLRAATRYCVAVEAWNGTSGADGMLTSPPANLTTLPVPPAAPLSPALTEVAILLSGVAAGAVAAVVAYRSERPDPARPRPGPRHPS